MFNAERCFEMTRFSLFLAGVVLIFAVPARSDLSQEELAPDRVVMDNGQVREGKILGVSRNGAMRMINFAYQGGQIPIPERNIRRVVLQERPSFKEGAQAYQDGDYARAVEILQPLADTYLGINSPWVGETVGMLSDSLIRMGKTFAANEWGEKLAEAFPDSPFRLKGQVTKARTLLDSGKADEAISTLEAVKGELPQVAVPEPAAMGVLSDVHLAMGEAYEAKGDKAKALENYLLVATVFHQPASQAKRAQAKANALRDQNPELAVN